MHQEFINTHKHHTNVLGGGGRGGKLQNLTHEKQDHIMSNADKTIYYTKKLLRKAEAVLQNLNIKL